MTDCMDAPEWAQKFDDKIYTLDKKSTYLVMCKSEHGCSCGRGMDSGFTNAIVSYRIHELQKPTTCNIKGGIYNFDAGPCHSGPAVSTGWPPDARKTGHWHWETGIRRVPRTGGLAS